MTEPITTPSTCPKLLTELKIPKVVPYFFPESLVINDARQGVRIAIPIEIKETNSKMNSILCESISNDMPILSMTRP